MQTVNIHEAKTHLSRLVENVATTCEPIIIAKAGKPRVQIVPLEHSSNQRQMGTLKGKIHVPDDFDNLFADEISVMFSGKEDNNEPAL